MPRLPKTSPLLRAFAAQHALLLKAKAALGPDKLSHGKITARDVAFCCPCDGPARRAASIRQTQSAGQVLGPFPFRGAVRSAGNVRNLAQSSRRCE
jgi:hypothetical protein